MSEVPLYAGWGLARRGGRLGRGQPCGRARVAWRGQTPKTLHLKPWGEKRPRLFFAPKLILTDLCLVYVLLLDLPPRAPPDGVLGSP